MTTPPAPPPPSQDPGQPQPGNQPPQPGYPASPLPQPAGGSKKARTGGKIVMRILAYLVAAVVLALVGYGWKVMSGDPTIAKVGDCLIDAAADDIKIVKCDDPKAVYKVEGEVKNITETAFNTDVSGDVCKAYPTAESGFWSGERGGNGTVLCLGKLKK